MKASSLLVIGFCSSLLAMPTVADDSGSTAFGNSAGVTSGNQTQKAADTMPDGAKSSAPEAATATGKAKAAPKKKSAGTGTLLRYIYDQDKKGNVKIEGMTDAGPPL